MTVEFYDTFQRLELSGGLGVSDSGHTWESTVFTNRRVNLVTNPSFETNTTGWGSTGATTIARLVSGAATSGAALLHSVVTGALPAGNSLGHIQLGVGSVTPGLTYTAQVRVRMASATPRQARVAIRFYNAAGTTLLTTQGASTLIADTSSPFTTLSVTEVAPATASRVAILVLNGLALVAGDEFYIDSAIIEQTSSVASYFDGSTPGGLWTGTAHASTSSGPSLVSATNLSANGQWAEAVSPTAGYYQGISVSGVTEADVDVVGRFSYETPVGDSTVIQVLSRVDHSFGQFLAGTVLVNPSGTTTISLVDTLTTVSSVAGGSWTGETIVNVRLRSVGSTHKIKVWFGKGTEPANWNLIATHTSSISSGSVGFRVGIGSSSTVSLPYTVAIHSLNATTAVAQATLQDTFTRLVYNGFGTSDSDHVYTVISGAASKLSVDGSRGIFSLTDDGNSVTATTPLSLTDFRLQFKSAVMVSQDDTMYTGVVARHTDTNNFMWFFLAFSDTDTLQASVLKRIGGVDTTIATENIGAFTPGDWYQVKAEVTGDTTRMKVWKDGLSEPSAWTIEVVDASLPPAPGPIGWRARRGLVGATGEGYVDDLSVRNVLPDISVEYVDDLESPGVRITMLNSDVYHRIRVTRVHIENRIAAAPVRGLDVVSISSSEASGMDYEIPLDESFNYKMEVFDSNLRLIATAISDSVDIPAPYHRVIIRSVRQPTLSQRVQITSFPGFSQSLRVLQEAKVLGRAKPVIIFDVMEGMTGSFEIMSTLDQSDPIGWKIRDLFRDGQPMLFQSVSRVTGIDDFYFVAESMTASRKETVHSTREPRYIYEISFREIDRPPTDTEALGFYDWDTLQEVGHEDWQSVNNAFTSWLDVLNFTSRTPL